MAINFDTVKAGDVLYQIAVSRGERTCYRVEVISVDHEDGFAVCSDNGNKPRKFHRSDVERWQRSPPGRRGRK